MRYEVILCRHVVSRAELVQLQREDATLTDCFVYASQPQNLVGIGNSRYTVHSNGLLIREFYEPGDEIEPVMQIVVPYALRGRILKLAHAVAASGHMGVAKTRKRVMQHFYWPGLAKDIQAYCASCDICQRNDKTCKRSKAPMITPPIIEEPFSCVSIDI